MLRVIESDEQIEFKETMPPVVRMILFGIGLLPFLVPYELLIRPHWDEFSPLLILWGIVSLGAVAIAFGFFGFAALGMNQSLCFDSHHRQVVYRRAILIARLRAKLYAYREVRRVDVVVHDWSEGPFTYGIAVTFSDGRRVEVGNFIREVDAVRYRQLVERLLHGAFQG